MSSKFVCPTCTEEMPHIHQHYEVCEADKHMACHCPIVYDMSKMEPLREVKQPLQEVKPQHDFIANFNDTLNNCIITPITERAMAWLNVQENENVAYLDLWADDGRDYVKLMKQHNYRVQEFYVG